MAIIGSKCHKLKLYKKKIICKADVLDECLNYFLCLVTYQLVCKAYALKFLVSFASHMRMRKIMCTIISKSNFCHKILDIFIMRVGPFSLRVRHFVVRPYA